MNGISRIATMTGIIVIICSIIRWFFLFYDPSQMVLGISIGIIICGYAYVYGWMKAIDEEMKKLNKRIDSFTKWWAKQEI